MKITEIETIPVRMPIGFFKDGVDKTGGKNAAPKFYKGEPLTRKPKRDADGHKLLDYVIVKIHTDEGIMGVGEAPTDTKEPLEAVKFIIDKMFTPNLIGLDPFNLERSLDLIRWRTSRGANRGSASAIDLALYDIVGKALNVNVTARAHNKSDDVIIEWKTAGIPGFPVISLFLGCIVTILILQTYSEKTVSPFL